MSKSHELVPRLRFPEFVNSGEWEEKVLKDISPSIFDGTHQTPKYVKKGIPFYSVENIVSKNKNKYISVEDYKLATVNNKPEKDDILITRIGNIGYSAIVSWDFDFSIYVTLAVIKKSNKFNSYYLHCYLQSPKYQKEILSKSLLNAVPCKINMVELRTTRIYLPKRQEQQKIADCFSSLDKAIEAEVEKLEALKLHKKGLMQKLFPIDDETVPQYRFPEFIDCGRWKETTISKIADYENGKAHENDIVENGKYIVVNSKFISTEGKVKKLTDIANMLARKNEILMVLSDIPNGRAIAKCFLVDKNNFYTVNQRICKLKAKSDNALFLFYLINRNKYFLAFDDGVNQTNLKKDDVLDCPLLLPQKDEQNKIVDCLSTLDNLISAQIEKVEALKAHKKGLMQGMFPTNEEENK